MCALHVLAKCHGQLSKDKRSRDSALGECYVYSVGFPGGSVVKNPSTNAGDAADLC